MKHRTSFAIVNLLLIATLAGCSLTGIPIFNQNARPLNRIASASEVITAVKQRADKLVLDGLITQEFLNTSIRPVLKKTRDVVDEAEALYTAGDTASSQNKLDVAAGLLRGVRDQLAAIERSKR